jgi:hypothetical protein
MRLSEFDLTIKPKPGTANGNADTPSRYPVDDADPDWSPDRMPQVTDIISSSTASFSAAGQQFSLNATTETAAARITVVSASKVTPPDFTASATTIAKGLSQTASRSIDGTTGDITESLRAQLIRVQRRDPGLLPVIEFLKGEVPALSKPFSTAQLARMHLVKDELLLIETPFVHPWGAITQTPSSEVPHWPQQHSYLPETHGEARFGACSHEGNIFGHGSQLPVGRSSWKEQCLRHTHAQRLLERVIRRRQRVHPLV